MSVMIAAKSPPVPVSSSPSRAPAPTQPANPRRLDGADALRAVAALAVIVVHTTHWALQDGGADAAVWSSVTLTARFCVPAFVLLTGLVLAYRYGDRPLGLDFLLRRTRRSLVPWLIWAPIFFAVDVLLTGEVQPNASSVRDWWSLGAGHLYFLLLVPQLYLVMLVWPRSRRAAGVAAGIAVAVQLTLCVLRLYAPVHAGPWSQGVLVHGYEEFPFWIGYFAVGVAAGRWLATSQRARDVRAWPFAGGVVVTTFLLLWVDVRGMVVRDDATGTGSFLRPLMLPMALAVCGAVFFGAPPLLRRMSRLRRATLVVSRNSLGMYIVHPLLLAVVGRLLASDLRTHVPGAIFPVLALTLAVTLGALLIAYMISRTPLAFAIGERRAPERELRGYAASPKRRSTAAASASVRRSAGGTGVSPTRNT